jgi:hypothetical protein
MVCCGSRRRIRNQYCDVELKRTGNKLDGTWSGNSDSGLTHGVKAVEQ